MQPSLSPADPELVDERPRAPQPDGSEPLAPAMTAAAGGQPLREGLRALMDPLSAVVGFASLLVESHLDDEERDRYARRIHEAARELEQRVRHLETITRHEAERAEQLALF